MAAQAWTIYNEAKDKIGTGAINLSADTFRIALCKSTSNAATATLSLFSEVTNEVNTSWGYADKTLSATTWSTGASASEMRFDSTAVFWSANGGTITSIQFAVIFKSASAGGGPLLCYSSLSSSVFEVTDTNRLTITPAANGIFELN